ALNRRHMLPQDAGFDAPELGLAARVEDFRNGGLFGGDDFLVDVEEAPPHIPRQRAADGGFGRAHEPHQGDSGSSFQAEIHRGLRGAAQSRLMRFRSNSPWYSPRIPGTAAMPR